MRLLGSIITASILFVPTTAMAELSGGKVERFDSAPRSLTLVGGETILIPDDLSIDNITAGDRVLVTWSLNGPEPVATRIVKQQRTNED